MATLLDWYGCATFRLRTAGLTIFLDAYIDRAEGAAGTGLSASDVDACDWMASGLAARLVDRSESQVVASSSRFGRNCFRFAVHRTADEEVVRNDRADPAARRCC